MPSDDERWLTRAVRLAIDNVAESGGPFGALVIGGDGLLLGEGRNRVTRDLDPSAHAEVVAIRAACRTIGDFALEGATLYSSCEPCPMCLTTALWARVGRIVYAADRDDAARGGFDDRAFYEMLARDRAEWDVPVECHRIASSTEPFEAWRAAEDRTHY